MTPGERMFWRWCFKNRVWALRTCGHSRCTRTPVTRRQDGHPAGEPTTAELAAAGVYGMDDIAERLPDASGATK